MVNNEYVSMQGIFQNVKFLALSKVSKVVESEVLATLIPIPRANILGVGPVVKVFGEDFPVFELVEDLE